MKTLIAWVVIPPVVVSFFWILGYCLSLNGEYDYWGGKGVFLLATFFWAVGVVGAIVAGVDSSFGEEKIAGICSLFLHFLLIFVVRWSLVGSVDYLYVQNIDNPRMSAEAEAIKNDPKKVQVLHDFLAGKVIKAEDYWPRADSSAHQLAIHRILGTSPEETKKIRLVTELPMMSTYYQAKPEYLENLKSKVMAEAE